MGSALKENITKTRIGILLVCVLWLASVASAKERRGIVTFKIDLPVKKESERARLWLPYPVSDEHQSIQEMKVKGNYTRSAIYREPKTESTYLFAEWSDKTESRKLEMSFQVIAKERKFKDLKRGDGHIPEEGKKYLESNEWIPTDGKIKEIATRITKEKEGVLEKSRAVYEWVVEHIYRDPDVPGCGLGIVEETLAARGGKCADISSLYVALARAAGVPAREVFGLRLGKHQEEDMTKGHHCWAEFYLPGTGWIPVDPADVRKRMLVKDLELNEADPCREYFFGAVDEYRIVLERGGRGVRLLPLQRGKALNYFMYPYAEVDGKPLEHLDPDNFSYNVQFKAM